MTRQQARAVQTTNSDDRHMPKPRCRAATEDGSPCKNLVKAEGMRCHERSHKGQPAVTPGQRRRPRSTASTVRSGTSQASRRRRSSRQRRGRGRRTKPRGRKGQNRRQYAVENLTAKQRCRVEQAAQLCGAVLADGWPEAVADRASDYVSGSTFQKLVRSRRGRCRVLADLARGILAVKDEAHKAVGSLAGWIVSLLGWGRLEQRFVQELARSIPLPMETKAIATARGVQVTGVLLCVLSGRDLTKCQCFVDLALGEAKTTVKKILVSALEDWTELAHFPPKRASSAPRG
jgi:hypothetical protein